MRSLKYALPFILLALIQMPLLAVQGTWTGTLAVAPADAKEGVVATLTFKEGEKNIVIHLHAEGDLAKDLKERAAKGDKVKITGNTMDEIHIKVSKVEKAE